VRTPRALNTLAAMYPPLVAPASGRYRFALRYKPENGVPGFGASVGDGSPWFTLPTGGHPFGGDQEVNLWLDLKSGQEVHLGIMNGAEGPPASFLMKAVTAVEVLDSRTGIREGPPQ
jgi:hypothetical protein